MATRIRTYSILIALLLSVLFLVAVGVSWGKDPNKLILNQVFSFRDLPWPIESFYGIGARPFSSPDGRNIYFPSPKGAEVVVVNWKENQAVRRIDLKGRLPARPMLGRENCDQGLFGLEFLPGTRYVMVTYCYSLFLLDSDTLEVLKKWGPTPKINRVLDFTFSPTLGRLALYWYIDGAGGRGFIRIYEVKNSKAIAEWPVRSLLRDIAFTLDGRYLATVIGFCEGKLRDTLSGEVISSWRRGQPCPSQIRFIPGRDYTFASSDGFSTMGIWNAHDGSMLRMTTVENRRDVGSRGNWALSPDGRWLAASVRGRRRDHRRQQDFIIWDLNTDEIVYQTPKKKWKKSLVDEQTAPFYVDFSPDGRYLFTLKYKEFTVYEIIEKQ